MPIRAATIVALLCSTASLLRADVVLLKNGDRVTGSVVRQEGQKLSFKSEHFGLISVPSDVIESITTDQDLHVALKDGRTLLGPLQGSADSVHVAGESVAKSNVVAIRNAEEQRQYECLVNPSWFALWNATARLGWAGSRGNADTSTFTFGFDASRTTRRDKASARMNLIRAVARTDERVVPTARAIRAGIKYDHNVHSRLFVNTFNDYEYDRFQKLDLRVVGGGGLGFLVWKTERDRLSLVAGGAANHETFDPAPEPRFTRNRGETYWGNDLTYQLLSSTSVIQSFRMFTPVPATNSYRLNFDLETTTKLNKWLTWNFSLTDRYLASPVSGQKRNDWLYTAGLSVFLLR